MIALALLCFGAVSLQAQTFPTPTGFTLPAGKSIIITYDVDVNAGACPTGTVPGTTNITNQSNVSGTNFATVQTTSTTTPFSVLSLGNLVYKDLNRDGDYDSGTDTGINGVLVRLYLDNGDGVLTAADGAAIATTTTAGSGLYSFNVCPGSYIVEIAASNFNIGGPLYDNSLSTALISSPIGGAADPDNDVNNDDNGDPVAGFGVASQAITMAYGAEPTTDGDADNNTNLSLDFGFKAPTTVSINDVTLAEGTGGSTTSFSFTVTRNDNGEAFSLAVNTADVTTAASSDFTAITGGTVNFTAGGSLTATVTVLVNQDNIVEANETFNVVLSGAPAGVILTDATGVGTITNDDAATVTLTGGIAQNEGNSSTTSYTFTATLNAAVQGGFSVAYTTSDGTATVADADYTDNDASLSFTGTVGETQTITVLVNGDTKVEPNEAFTVALGAISSAPAGVTVGGTPQTGTITNDDASAISINDVSVNEGNTGTTAFTFTVTLSQPISSTVTVNYATADGTATAGSDYTATSGTLSFLPNAALTQTVTVLVNGDLAGEPNETFFVNLSNPAGGPGVTLADAQGQGTILDDDLSFSINDVTLAEGNAGTTNFTFTVTRTSTATAETINFTTANNTATTGDNDYVLNSGTLNFAIGDDSETITVVINGDQKVELNESFFVNLSNASNGSIADAQGLGTITNDDQAVLSINSVSNTEGNAGTQTYTFTVTSDKAVDVPFTINAGTVNGTATTGDNDYAPNSATLNFAGTAGESHTFSVTVNGDLKVEPNETFTVPLSTVVASGRNVVISEPSGTGTGTITNDDAATISITDVSLAEGNVGTTNFVFNVTLSQVVSTAVTVDFATANGTAGAGDYNTNSGTLTFPANGAGQTQTITVQVIGDLTGEANETFFVNLSNILGSSSVTAPDAQGQGTILDDDLSFSINDVSLAEGNAGTSNLTFTVTRTSTATAETINFTTVNNTATTGDNDYVLNSGTLNFAIGDDSETITVVINGDQKVEVNESFFVNLSNASNGSIADAQGVGTINNDDAATVTLTGGVAQNEGNSGTTNYTFTATLNNPVQGGFSVAYTTSDGTATVADADYTDNDGSLSFAGTAGETQTFTVLVNGDTKVEANETFTVALGAISSAPTGVTVAGTSQTGTITNDDAATVTLTGGIAQNEGNSGTTSYTFTATLNNPVQGGFSVAYTTNDGTATVADNDYTDKDGSLSFAGTSGETQTFTVLVNGDTKVEANETFTVALGAISSAPTGVTVAGTSQTGTITNDDAATLTLSGGIVQNEGNSGTTSYTFTATLSAAVQGGFSVAYTTNDGTATVADNDYTDKDGSLSFTGTSGEAQTITVLVIGDHKVEADETFTVALGNITGTTLNASITKEGSPQTGTVTNDEIDFGDAPTAAQSGFTNSYPTLTADAGGSHGTIAGIYLGSTIDGEDNGQPTATANGDGSDDDGVTLPANLITGTTANITVNASVAGYINAWIDYNRDGDWNDEGEKIFSAQSVTAGNNSLSIAVPVGASVGTSFARFRFTTSSESISFSGKAVDGEVEDYQVTILNTQFSVNSPSIAEGNSGTKLLKFVISRNQNGNAASVDYTVAGVTATSGSDFQPVASGTLNFSAGGALTDTVRVTINGDVLVEDNETLTVTLSNPVGGGISTGTGTGTITNDDTATLTLTGGIAQNEGNSGTTNYTFTATLSAAVQGGFSVPYTTNDGTATVADADYTDNDNTLTFTGTAGEAKTITVLVNGDTKVELNETFTVALGAITGLTPVQLAATTVAGSPQTGTITNDDAATVAIAGNINQSESATPQTFSVTLSNPVDVAVTVKFSTSDGTATAADNDYTAITNQLVTFPAGTTTAQSVNVTVANDAKVEADEAFNVGLSDLLASSRNVTLGTSTATGTITNNDVATLTLSGGIAKAEGNSGTTAYTFTATLNAAIQGGFTIAYTTSDGTATVADNDYADNDNSLSFTGTAGETKDITVLVTGDQKVEANETFTVALGAFSATTLDASISKIGTPQTGTINNDEVDWGDAPDPTYPTLLANNGARHTAVLGMYLGTAIDGDNDGQPTATANGDDTDAEGDDDDGVTFPLHLLTGINGTITVTASAVGKLDAWIDFNRDGDWSDAGEQIATSLSLTAGANQVTFAVPTGSPDGNAPARFRFSSAGGLAVTGLAADGEVEDHLAPIINTLRIFVNVANVNPTQNGMTWATAFASLQAGLSAAANSSLPDIEVWVAQGTYKPGTLRKDVFEIPTNIRVYGGFDGTENDLSQRNWKTKVTTLSGEIGTNALTDNSQHVVLFRATNAATRLDGFTIEKGYAEFFTGNSTSDVSAPTLQTSGGGILALNKSKGVIANCTVTGNKATAGGGIMVRDTSDMIISKTAIWGNEATFGGGVYVLDGSKPRFENVLIVQNKGLGGGIYVNRSQPDIINSTIASNLGTNGTAGGVFNTNSVTTVKNSIVWGNSSPQTTAGSVITYSIVEGGYAGTGNSSLNPLFVNPTPSGLALIGPLGDYHLQACSPAINAGDNTGAPAEDLDGAVRPYAVGLAIVDMGAYESQSAGGSGPAELTVTEPITSGTVLKTAGKITATNQISGATVTYQAGQSVTLLPGFTATGSTFQAVIGNCPN